MTVPVTVSMPRGVYRVLKPWLVRRGVEILRAGVNPLSGNGPNSEGEDA